MTKRQDFIKILSIIPIVFYRKYDLLLPGAGRRLPVAELFLQNIFSGNPSRQDTDIIVVVFGLLEVIVFNLLFGTHISYDLYENSVYVFVREKSRNRWFLRKTAELFWFSAIYNLLFTGLTFYLCVMYSELSIDMTACRVFVITYILMTLFAFWSTLLINLFAVFVGSTSAFMINYVILILLSSVAIGFESIPVWNRYPILLKLNPVSNVTLRWNDGMGKGLLPAVYFMILCMLTYMAGSIFISKKDISIENKE